MTKQEAKTELKLLSSGTLAKLTGIRTYNEQDVMLQEKLDMIDTVDVSECENWVQVWDLVKNGGV